jgi:hypothetical protein
MASIKPTLPTVIKPKVAAAGNAPDNIQNWYRMNTNIAEGQHALFDVLAVRRVINTCS